MFRSLLRDRDVIAGTFFFLFGAGAVFYAFVYPVGTLTNMGPGYFPAILGGLLIFFGAATLASAALASGRVALPAVALRPLLAIAASVLAFAFLLDSLGLPLSVFVCSLIASAARPRFYRPANLLLAAALAALSVLLFIRLLGVPIPVLPPALQGY